MDRKEKIKALRKLSDDLRLALPAERRAAEFYSELAEKPGVGQFKGRLERMAQDERAHTQELEALIGAIEEEISRLSSG